uniref:uncharacterized protein isoform X1 n=1 Tax=Myxine glutinosa TaxID=7769 RepID=UPI00358EACCB
MVKDILYYNSESDVAYRMQFVGPRLYLTSIGLDTIFAIALMTELGGFFVFHLKLRFGKAQEIPLKKQEMLKSTNKQLMDILKEAAETNENVVANPNWQRK